MAALPKIGLLGEAVSLGVEQTFRETIDRYPEVVVASSIQSQQSMIEAVLHEWGDINLMLSFGLEASDTTVVAAGDVNVVDETQIFNSADLIVLNFPLKAGESVVVTDEAGATPTTTYTAGTDYIVLPRDLQGRTLIYRVSGGGIAANATVYVDYTYNLPARREMPIGRKSATVYRSVRLVEDLDNGGRWEAHIWRCRVGMRGGLNPNASDPATSAAIPITIQALYEPSQDMLWNLVNFDPFAA
jgi:hypothetical protein